MKLSFKIRYSYGDEMGVTINGTRYIYSLDGGHALKIIKLSKYRPGKALKLLKKVSYHYEREKEKTSIPRSNTSEPDRSSNTRLGTRG